MLEARALGRSLWRNRASSLAAIFMLGAAAAAAATSFALADAVLWRDLPYREPWKLAMLLTRHVDGEAAVSLPDLTVLRDQAAHARLAAATAAVPEYALTGFGDPRQYRGRMLTADYFATLGVPLALGRDFLRAEERSGAGTVAILTDKAWAELFERRPEALGASLALNGRSFTVVGVLTPFRDPFGEVEVYVPHQFAPELPRRFRMLTPIARLNAGASLEDFRAEVRRLTSNTGDPEAAGYSVDAVSFQDRLAAGVRSSVSFLFAGAVGLLLMALLNFSMLAAARTDQRLGELSIRLALGATPGRVLRLAAAEAGLLAGLAALLAFACSHLAVPLLQSRYGDGIVNQVGLGARALLFLALIALAAVGVAVMAAQRALSRRLSAERVIVSSRLTAGRALVVAQSGISLALVISSALLARSFDQLSRVDPGFHTAGIHTARIALPAGRYRDPQSRITFWDTLLDRLRGRGAAAAAVTTELPLSGQDNPTSFNAKLAGGETVPVSIRSVSPGYFDLLGIPLLAGRGLSQGDGPQAPQVILVNEVLASRLRRLGDPVGQLVGFDFIGKDFQVQVVGVVGDVRHKTLSAPGAPEAYFPFAQTPLVQYTLLVTGPANAGDAAALLRSTLDTVDPAQSFARVRSMSDYVAQDLARPRTQAQLMAFFALVALVVAASGLYSLLAYLVAGSRREWAVRLALGASQASLLRAVLRQSLVCAVLGVVVGAGVLLVVRATLRALLFGVSMWDPLVVAGCVTAMISVCVLTAMVPALRANRISAAEILTA